MTEEPKVANCRLCNREMIEWQNENDRFEEGICQPCWRRYPPALIKATADDFQYALKLTTGDVFEFESATIHGDYATLKIFGKNLEQLYTPARMNVERGVDVRVDQIVWCVDAPYGS